jgi:hypothetical protein
MWPSKSCHYPMSTNLVQGIDLIRSRITCELMWRFSPDSLRAVNHLHKIRGSRSSQFTQPLLILSSQRTGCVVQKRRSQWSPWFWWSRKFSRLHYKGKVIWPAYPLSTLLHGQYSYRSTHLYTTVHTPALVFQCLLQHWPSDRQENIKGINSVFTKI